MKIGMMHLASGAPLWRGPDILVHPEQIARIVLRLDRGKTLRIAEIGPPYAVRVVLRDEVDVGAAGRKRRRRVEQRPRPGDALAVVRRFAPARVDVDQELRRAVRI